MKEGDIGTGRLTAHKLPDMELIQAIRQQYRLPWNGIHGAAHWARVLENGWCVAESSGANREVVALFAVFHDACRWNEDHDPEHGRRGAALAAMYRGQFFELSDPNFLILQTACSLHTTGRTHPDITVQTCWDADRLDLMRVGIQPDPRFLCTLKAKQPDMIVWAVERSCREHIPSFALEEWGCLGNY